MKKKNKKTSNSIELKTMPLYPRLIERIARLSGLILGESKLKAFIASQSTPFADRIQPEAAKTQPQGPAVIVRSSNPSNRS